MNIKLYYHKTSGGAKYLTDTFIKWKHNGKSGKEGTMTDKTKYIVRIDGDITKDCELFIKEQEKHKERECGWTRDKAKCDYAIWWDCSFLCSNKKINPKKELIECRYKCPNFERCKQEGMLKTRFI